MIAEIALAGSNWFPCMEPTWLHYFITAVHRWSVQYKMKMSSLVFAPQGFCTPKCVMCPSWTMCVPRVVCSSLAPGSRITWLGSIDLQCTVLVLSLFHERFLDSHLSYKMSSTATQRMDKAYSLMAAMMIVLGAVAYGLAARVWSPPGGLFGFSALEVVGWNLLLGLLGCLNASPPMLFDGACSLGGCDMYVGLEVVGHQTQSS